MTDVITESASPLEVRRPRLGFLGLGAIGLSRLKAIAGSGAGSVAAICDADRTRIASQLPGTRAVSSIDELLSEDLDGIVIATSPALHAEQAIAALERGLPVFCQKPLGRNAAETRRVIDAARTANVLLGVDMPYRHTAAMRVLRSTVQAGELGDIFAVDAVFHCASAPGADPGSDSATSGDGCVLDLGIHLVDIALWTLGFPRVIDVTSRLHAGGERVPPGHRDIAEDYAVAHLDLDTGVTVRLACSWNLAVGENARIEATFYGTEGAGSFRNVKGSFNDFTAELFQGTNRHTLAAPPDNWGGRTAVAWSNALARGQKYDPWVEGVADVAQALDRIRS